MVLVLGLVAAGGSALGRSFTLVGYPAQSGGNASRVYGLSDDGNAAAGYSYIGVGRTAAFNWTEASGRRDFGLDAGRPRSTVGFGISGDGTWTVGYGFTSGVGYRAYRYRDPNTYQALGSLAGYRDSQAYDASYDGSVVVGRAQDSAGANAQAFRWTEQSGMQGLGFVRSDDFHSEARAASRDGQTVVGQSFGVDANAFVWTTGGGMQGLEKLSGTLYAEAFGVNGDGTLIVGDSGSCGVLWDHGRVRELERPSGWGSMEAVSVSDDGGVIVGTRDNGVIEAVVWTPERAWLLADYLAANGVTLPDGFHLTYCTSVSADGRTFAGWGAFAGGGSEGFVATIPSPGPIAFAVGGVLLVRRRTRRSVGS